MLRNALHLRKLPSSLKGCTLNNTNITMQGESSKSNSAVIVRYGMMPCIKREMTSRSWHLYLDLIYLATCPSRSPLLYSHFLIMSKDFANFRKFLLSSIVRGQSTSGHFITYKLWFKDNTLFWKWVKWSHSVVSDSLRPHWLSPTRLLPPWDSPGKSTGVGCHFLLQGIFPIQGSNPGLWHSRQTL